VTLYDQINDTVFKIVSLYSVQISVTIVFKIVSLYSLPIQNIKLYIYLRCLASNLEFWRGNRGASDFASPYSSSEGRVAEKAPSPPTSSSSASFLKRIFWKYTFDSRPPNLRWSENSSSRSVFLEKWKNGFFFEVPFDHFYGRVIEIASYPNESEPLKKYIIVYNGNLIYFSLLSDGTLPRGSTTWYTGRSFAHPPPRAYPTIFPREGRYTRYRMPPAGHPETFPLGSFRYFIIHVRERTASPSHPTRAVLSPPGGPIRCCLFLLLPGHIYL